MQEGNEEPFNIRLHLAKDILTIQEQDVICVSGEPFYSSVSKRIIEITCDLIVKETLLVASDWHVATSLAHISEILLFARDLSALLQCK